MRSLFIILLICLVACRSNTNKPRDIIPQDKFTDILYQIEIVDALRTQKDLDQENNDEETYQRYNLIFKDHQVSEHEFTRSFDHYKKNTTLYMMITDSIISRLTKEEQRVSQELRDSRWRTKKDQEGSKSSK